MSRKNSTKPVCRIKEGMNYTKMQIAYIVSRALEANGYVLQAKEFRHRFMDCYDQEEGWRIIGEYVTIEKR